MHLVADEATQSGFPLYIVGGSVRDLILDSVIKDLDFTLEGDAIKFARALAKKHGGKVITHDKFHTTTWSVNSFIDIDIVSARKETYEQPGALPSVKRSGIDDDIRRRDFTINGMALRLDRNHFGELTDPLNGQADIERGWIRVLHPRSFVDDPTRMFRAVRYAGRYGFEIEAETLQLFNGESRKILSQLSGERLRHEFDLIFDEAKPDEMMKQLKDLNLLSIIHSSLSAADGRRLTLMVDKPEEDFGEFAVPEILSFKQTLGWILYLMNLSEKEVEGIAKKLAFPVLLTKATCAASFLYEDRPSFVKRKPSEWTFHLDGLPSLAVYAVWLANSESPLKEYLTKWQKVGSFATGDDLKARGLNPGPKFKEILFRLRAAWLDGEVKTEEEEKKLLNSLIMAE